MVHISITKLAEILAHSDELTHIPADDIYRVLELFFEVVESVQGPIYMGHDGLVKPEEGEEVHFEKVRDGTDPVH